jgi:hypothetical protein
LTRIGREADTEGVQPGTPGREAITVMTSENEKKIELIKRVAEDGSSCPDGATCPAQWKTSWGTRLTQGRPVTDPEVLKMVSMPPGEVLVETPEALWQED